MIIEYTGRTPEAKIKTLAESVQLALNTIEAQSLQTGAIKPGSITKIELADRAVSATKLNVNDLAELNTTIAGFNINSNAIYKGCDSSTSTTPGLYICSNRNDIMENPLIRSVGSLTGDIADLIAGCLELQNTSAGITWTVDVSPRGIDLRNSLTQDFTVIDQGSIILGDQSGCYCYINSDWRGSMVLGSSGNQVKPVGNGQTNLGTSTSRWKAVYADNGTIQTSDRRLKKNIANLNGKYLDFFDKLQPISYNSIDDKDIIHLGFIAQDIEQALADVGLDKKKHSIVDDGTDNGKNKEDSFYGLNYSEFIAVLVNKIKQLEQRIEILEGGLL